MYVCLSLIQHESVFLGSETAVKIVFVSLKRCLTALRWSLMAGPAVATDSHLRLDMGSKFSFGLGHQFPLRLEVLSASDDLARVIDHSP